MKTLLYLLFEVALFLLLAMKLTELIKQFLIPSLRKQIVALGQFWKDLQNKITLLSTTKKRLHKQSEQQTERFKTLEKKISHWHAALTEDQKKLEREHTERMISLSQKKKDLCEQLLSIKAERALLPQALAQTKEKLIEAYGGDLGKQLLAKTLEQLATANKGERS